MLPSAKGTFKKCHIRLLYIRLFTHHASAKGTFKNCDYKLQLAQVSFVIDISQCSWITKIKLVCGDIILCVASLVHYTFTTTHIFVTIVLGDVNSWVKVIHDIQEH